MPKVWSASGCRGKGSGNDSELPQLQGANRDSQRHGFCCCRVTTYRFISDSNPVGSTLVKREQDAIRDNFETDFLLNKVAVGVVIRRTVQLEDF
jgi:hypothetical protein